MIKTNFKTTTYSTGIEDVMIDIMEGRYEREAYIYRSGYGIKLYMFGIPFTDDNFLDLVERNLPSYLKEYDEEYAI